MSILTRCAAALAVAALSLACSDDSNDGPPGGGGSAGMGGSGGTPATGVTFTDDIHPILLAKCGGSQCHDGSNAPTSP